MHVEWIIFYSDGTSFSSADGPPEKAPKDYVNCVAVVDQSCGVYCLAEQNYYCWHRQREHNGTFYPAAWVPHDADGLRQYKADESEPQIILSGYWIQRDLYSKIRADALRDPRLPAQTAKPPRQPEGE